MRKEKFSQLILSLLGITVLLLSSSLPAAQATQSQPIPPINPTSVTIAGSLQSELGCAGDWAAGCAATHLTLDATDDVWQGVWTVPVGNWEYKATIDDSWNENYGANAVRDGNNIALSLAADTSVKFYYDHKSHWITDNHSSTIATAAGSFQSEIGCPGDWQENCLRSWLQDPDSDGIYSFSTLAIPFGNYEFKVTIDESWNVNYGQGGAQNGANVPFTVPGSGYIVTFFWNSATKEPWVTVVSSSPRPDNNIFWDGVRHDSRDLLYRTPGGAVSAGQPVIIRLRTYHDDVTSVKLRVYDLNAGGQSVFPMSLAASDVDCYEPVLPFSCDFWQYELQGYLAPNNLWYRFIITDGSDTDYYADNTPALDGGLGAMSEEVVDQSYALMFYDPAFSSPGWSDGAFIYQIFPDRFRNGRKDNDAKTGDLRYDDPVLKLPWNTLPEGFCRNYADGSTNCPWRFDTTPPAWSPLKEGPRGRDYMGGDLKGVDQNLNYLKLLGVDTIYFNPIFDAASNHSYDTQDYFKIDPYFGTQKDWENLVKHAKQLNMRIVVDGVFNHLSSDSPFFDRYHHYAAVGACESIASPYRSWFTFHDVPAGTGTCVSSSGVADGATYDGWFGFDSIPVINKSLPAVQQYFLTGPNNVSRYWLRQGASGWRMDVMGDSSFPNGYWETFRAMVKGTKPDALIISETWQKDSTLLRMLRGDRADTTMNYRLRDAVIGLLAPNPFDSKGFADSGRIIEPSEFAARLLSIREDYPDAAYFNLMNLLDSHDTERLQWTLNPGGETTAEKELNAANVATAKLRQRIASLIQFTVPGAPTVYYGDEVGLTGDDDPDDRRTYPWTDQGSTPDMSLFSHYQTLATLRKQNTALIQGDFRVLLADDTTDVVAYGRKTTNQAAVVIINRSDTAQSSAIPVAGYLPDGLVLNVAYAVGSGPASPVSVVNGQIDGAIGAWSAVLLLSGPSDLMPPEPPTGLMVTNEGDGTVDLAWNAVSGAVGYNLYRSPVVSGGWVKQNSTPVAGTSYQDSGLRNATYYFYVVTALDSVGNESGTSNEVKGLPHYTIGWANLQWPYTMNHVISAVNHTPIAYGQVWIDGITNQPGPTPSLWAQLGFGPAGSNPTSITMPGTSNGWTWVDATFNVDAGSNDEFMASLLPEEVGNYDYVFRYSTTNGHEWLYADLNGPIASGAFPPNPGKLTVVSSGDITPPAEPTGLMVVSASPAAIDLTWDPILGDPSLYGYEVRRSDTPGGPYTTLALVTTNSYNDLNVVQDATYYYVVRSIDASFNRSGDSAEATATAQARTVSVVFNVTVPASTDATGLSVYIAGTLSRLDGGLPDWNPGGVVLTRLDATTWTVTLTGLEGTAIEYKYALGSWDYVEKDNTCNEVNNRLLTLSYGETGTQTVNDTVLNWRNVSPCGG
jgi:glycosidase